MVGQFSLWAACYFTDFHLTRQTVGTGYFFQSNPKSWSVILYGSSQPSSRSVCLPLQPPGCCADSSSAYCQSSWLAGWAPRGSIAKCRLTLGTNLPRSNHCPLSHSLLHSICLFLSIISHLSFRCEKILITLDKIFSSNGKSHFLWKQVLKMTREKLQICPNILLI